VKSRPADHPAILGGPDAEEAMMDEQFELPRDALTTFLYLLMRDLVPTGKVRRLIDEAMSAEHPTFSAPELHALAARYAMDLGSANVVDAEVEEAPEEEKPFGAAPVQRIRSISNGILMREEEGADLAPEMREFLGEFDDRISRLPTFVEAVNRAADEELSLGDYETVRWVADLARQLHEEARVNG
jgi:hypothetical protein